MAVIGQCECGFLVDHRKSISESVSSLSLSCKEAFFALYEPHFRTSTNSSSSGSKRRKRKKSVQVVRTEEELDAAAHHSKIKDTISTGTEKLVRIGVDMGYFLPENDLREQSNLESELALTDCKHFSGLSTDVQSHSRCLSSDHLEPLIIKGDFTGSEKSLLNRIIYYPGSKPTVLNVSGEKYILPADCNFLMSDAQNLGPLVNYAQCYGGYNLLVLDPPWFNKSAKRGSKYSFMSLWQIKSLPVPCLLAPGALVGIWVTNKQKYLRFTRTELFPHWSMELMAEWYWVKVTRKGELVTDLDSPHKKPYEPLLLGRFNPKMDGLRSSCCLINNEKNSSEKEMESAFVDRGSLNESSLPTKRKKISDNDDDDIRTEYTCDINKNTAMAISLEWNPPLIYKSVGEITSQDSRHCETGVQNPRNCWLNCQGVYHENKMDITQGLNSPTEVVQKQQAMQKVKEQGQKGSIGIMKNSLKISSEQSEPKELEPDSKPCELLPYHQIICSVPCKIHSRKPPLHEIFSKYMPPNSLCLEMFARNLTPHWTSWGNEVLKFQSMEYFEECTTEQVPRKIQEKNSILTNCYE